jgi:hypothetical protein
MKILFFSNSGYSMATLEEGGCKVMYETSKDISKYYVVSVRGREEVPEEEYYDYLRRVKNFFGVQDQESNVCRFFDGSYCAILKLPIDRSPDSFPALPITLP